MLVAHAIPLLLISVLVGLLLGLLVWGFLRTRSQRSDGSQMEARDDVLLALLILAAFAMGVFLTYALLSSSFFR